MIEHQYFVLYKPDGYLSQFINPVRKRKNKKLLGELYPFPKGTMAVGRLDEATEGLLLLTTDGSFSRYVTGGKIAKTYVAQVDGDITPESIEQMKLGLPISINGETVVTKPAQVRKLDKMPLGLPARNKKIRDERHGPTSWVEITISEGKFRQVRKMTAKVGYPTLRLIRVKIGKIEIGDMQPGEVRKIGPMV